MTGSEAEREGLEMSEPCWVKQRILMDSNDKIQVIKQKLRFQNADGVLRYLLARDEGKSRVEAIEFAKAVLLPKGRKEKRVKKNGNWKSGDGR
jgi:hypothetical protein